MTAQVPMRLNHTHYRKIEVVGGGVAAAPPQQVPLLPLVLLVLAGRSHTRILAILVVILVVD
jgi:hypothetical protein